MRVNADHVQGGACACVLEASSVVGLQASPSQGHAGRPSVRVTPRMTAIHVNADTELQTLRLPTAQLPCRIVDLVVGTTCIRRELSNT